MDFRLYSDGWNAPSKIEFEGSYEHDELIRAAKLIPEASRYETKSSTRLEFSEYVSEVPGLEEVASGESFLVTLLDQGDSLPKIRAGVSEGSIKDPYGFYRIVSEYVEGKVKEYRTVVAVNRELLALRSELEKEQQERQLLYERTEELEKRLLVLERIEKIVPGMPF